MTKWMKCDNCGQMRIDPYRLPYAEKEAAWEALRDSVLISLEHDDDQQSFDACSWACVAEIALRQSVENATISAEESGIGP